MISPSETLVVSIFLLLAGIWADAATTTQLSKFKDFRELWAPTRWLMSKFGVIGGVLAGDFLSLIPITVAGLWAWYSEIPGAQYLPGALVFSLAAANWGAAVHNYRELHK